MSEGQPPGVGELLEELNTVRALAENRGEQPSLEAEICQLASLLEQRLDLLIAQPERGKEMLQAGMPPNLDLFADHPASFAQQMALDRAVVLEEMQRWREELQALSSCLAVDGKRVSPPPERMHQWLNRLEAWLQKKLDR